MSHPFENYNFNNKDLKTLLERTLSPSWVYQKLPWDLVVEPGHFVKGNVPSLLEALPEYASLSNDQKEQVKFQESIYHISNLLAGEHKAVSLAAQVLVESPQHCPDIIHPINTIIADETKHFLALSQYLETKVGFYYQPHPRIKDIFVALSNEEAYEIKLFAAQVVLEWTATALLSSLILKHPEPLFGEIVKKILQDEVRHLTFNRLVFSHLDKRRLQRLGKRMEEMLFEVIVATISSFFAIPVWQEYGFSKSSCRKYAVNMLEEKGVLHFYTRVLPKELNRCHLHSDRLIHWLEKDLIHRIAKDHWSFSPKRSERTPYTH